VTATRPTRHVDAIRGVAPGRRSDVGCVSRSPRRVRRRGLARKAGRRTTATHGAPEAGEGTRARRRPPRPTGRTSRSRAARRVFEQAHGGGVRRGVTATRPARRFHSRHRVAPAIRCRVRVLVVVCTPPRACRLVGPAAGGLPAKPGCAPRLNQGTPEAGWRGTRESGVSTCSLPPRPARRASLR
jgi:hypothetical protein